MFKNLQARARAFGGFLELEYFEYRQKRSIMLPAADAVKAFEAFQDNRFPLVLTDAFGKEHTLVRYACTCPQVVLPRPQLVNKFDKRPGAPRKAPKAA